MTHTKKVSVLGAGSWGTALSKVLANNGYDVHLWAIDESISNSINEKHVNQKYLPNETLPTNITCSLDLAEVLENTSLVLFVIPSHALRKVAEQTKLFIPVETPIVHATKGFEIDSFKRMSEILFEYFPQHNISVLSGPSHAEEVVKGFPTVITLASKKLEHADYIRDFFMNDCFRVYTSDDICGVELGGSLKNVFALGAGISDGLGFGDNAKAAILTRGLKEMTDFCSHMGAKKDTIYGLTGIGDLIVTGTSKHSRNWKTGFLLGQGWTLEEALEEVGMVAEGVKATRALFHYSTKENIDMPITQQIYKVLFENKNANDSVYDLMLREKKKEH